MKIISIKHLSEYKLKIQFSNGTERVVDFKNWLSKQMNPMATQFRDIDKFKKVEIDTGFLSWGNGEMEISAENLYQGRI